jgi:hypothetical protein
MPAEKRKLARLLRLERVRSIARQTAASEAASAESTLAKLRDLADRTQGLAADYAGRLNVRDGADLVSLGHFTRGLHGILANTEADVTRARAVADRRLAELAAAERRRAAVEERATRTAQSIATKAEVPALGARKTFGTALE